MSEPFPIVAFQWINDLAEITAMTLASFRTAVAHDTIAMLAVDCHPADGIISLSMLMSAEAEIDPTVVDPARTPSWRHQGFERTTGMWRLAAGVERVMQETYHCAEQPDRPAIAKAFVRACGEVIRSERVWSELEQFRRSDDFKIAVPTPPIAAMPTPAAAKVNMAAPQQ